MRAALPVDDVEEEPVWAAVAAAVAAAQPAGVHTPSITEEAEVGSRRSSTGSRRSSMGGGIVGRPPRAEAAGRKSADAAGRMSSDVAGRPPRPEAAGRMSSDVAGRPPRPEAAGCMSSDVAAARRAPRQPAACRPTARRRRGSRAAGLDG